MEMFRRMIARFLAFSEINDIWFEDDGEICRVMKRRRWYATFLIPPGNLIACHRAVPVEALSKGDWLKWERALYELLYNCVYENRGGGVLQMPRIRGECLQDYLRDYKSIFSMQERGIRSGLKALRQLHDLDAPGLDVLFSHGDATVRNVLYDLDGRTACWFDFDMRHRMDSEPYLRQADDIRAFVFSALPYIANEHIEALAGIAIEYCDDVKLRDALLSILQNARLDYDFYHLAQCLAPYEKRCLCRDTLIRAIGHLENQ